MLNHKNKGYGTDEACAEIRDAIHLERRSLAMVGKVVILLLAAVHILKELFQFTQVGRWMSEYSDTFL